MAVYTKINHDKIEKILSFYDLGKLDQFKGIEEGIENTNYFLSVEKKKFILTIYEKRVKSVDLPFFSNLMSSLILFEMFSAIEFLKFSESKKNEK